MNCPLDNTPLQLTVREGIEIDYCPACRGVWLDRGELDKLVERSNAQSYSRPARVEEAPHAYHRNDDDDRDHDHDKHHYDNRHDQKKHKKEGFLGDLFDF